MKRNLSVVSGLCLRFSKGFQETVSRLQEGAVGDIHTLQANDYRDNMGKTTSTGLDGYVLANAQLVLLQKRVYLNDVLSDPSKDEESDSLWTIDLLDGIQGFIKGFLIDWFNIFDSDV